MVKEEIPQGIGPLNWVRVSNIGGKEIWVVSFDEFEPGFVGPELLISSAIYFPAPTASVKVIVFLPYTHNPDGETSLPFGRFPSAPVAPQSYKFDVLFWVSREASWCYVVR